MRFRLAVLATLLFASHTVFALPLCQLTMVERTTCKIDVYDLHPAQSVVGMRQIASNIEWFRSLGEKKLHDYIKAHPVPVVLSPDGQFYMIDKHHMSRAYIGLERSEYEVYATVQANWTKLTMKEFWQRMRAENYVWLFDENGLAIADPATLPARVQDLRDDPYRSVAWAVREAGGFEDLNLPFAELLWANYFRSRVMVGESDRDFKRAIKEALVWAHNPEARDLPGYIPLGF